MYQTHHEIVEENSRKAVDKIRSEVLPKRESADLAKRAEEAEARADEALEIERQISTRWLGMKQRLPDLRMKASDIRAALGNAELNGTSKGEFWGHAAGNPDHRIGVAAAHRIAEARAVVPVLKELSEASEKALADHIAKMEAFAAEHGIPNEAWK